MRLSDFGREAIERSGSYRFADHLYQNKASGKGVFGRLLDRLLLNMPAAQAMRRRYIHIMNEMESALEQTTGAFHILAVPCGIPRDVAELAQKRPELASRIHYVGMDIDTEVVEAADDFLQETSLGSKELTQGDALNPQCFLPNHYNMIVSTGLGEFLDDRQLLQFYGHVFNALRVDGTFCTSTTAREKRSDYLLRAFELQTNYRNTEETEALLSLLPWKKVQLRKDPSGLQTFVTATR